jgi:hypothetical protein
MFSDRRDRFPLGEPANDRSRGNKPQPYATSKPIDDSQLHHVADRTEAL